jgi:hypothetical protein
MRIVYTQREAASIAVQFVIFRAHILIEQVPPVRAKQTFPKPAHKTIIENTWVGNAMPGRFFALVEKRIYPNHINNCMFAHNRCKITI